MDNSEKIIQKLEKSFNEPSNLRQELGCIRAISETMDNLAENGSQSDFMIELRNFIINYNQE